MIGPVLESYGLYSFWDFGSRDGFGHYSATLGSVHQPGCRSGHSDFSRGINIAGRTTHKRLGDSEMLFIETMRAHLRWNNIFVFKICFFPIYELFATFSLDFARLGAT